MQRGSPALIIAMLLVTYGTHVSAQQTADREQQIAGWVAQLDSTRFAERDFAMRQLILLGAEAAQPLSQAANSGSRERAQRTLHILRQLGFSEDRQDEAAARTALDQLTESRKSVTARGATVSLASIDRFHQAPAIEALQRLGAKIVYGQRRSQFGAFPPVIIIENSVEFNSTWKGQPEDFQYLRRLVELDSVTITGVGIPESIMDHLVDLPKLAHLDISKVRFSDDSLAKLSNIESLEDLRLQYSPFTDRAVPHLVELKHVKRMQLMGTDMTRQAADQLRTAHDGIDLEFHRGALLGVQSTLGANADGCLVEDVKAGTAAANAKILAGDLIIAIDDKDIKSFDELKQAMADKRHGETVTIRVKRRGDTLNLKTILGEWDTRRRTF